ncbi:uncharacterized protein LOC120082131 isoform X2 [Benincasa hispida]|uniref:uncharacterized protein LOC120082131 isoform X2 n=1 Tax=Benincasa hispida TaxID=102211 RepID=UPI0019013A78|nr:uncharacterized protein LOC120082131 isoform X2 [Benincasa hispida]
MASARFPSFHFHSPVSTRRRPSDHRRAPRCHGGVGDEENQKDIVDANLTVLRARMEDLRKKERRIPLPARRGGLEFDNGWRVLGGGDYGWRCSWACFCGWIFRHLFGCSFSTSFLVIG